MNRGTDRNVSGNINCALEQISRIMYMTGNGPDRWPGVCPLRRGCPHIRRRRKNATILVACIAALMASWWAGGLYATRDQGKQLGATTVVAGANLAVSTEGMLEHLANATAPERYVATISGWTVREETSWLVGYVASGTAGNRISYDSFLGAGSDSMLRFMGSRADSIAAADKETWAACPPYPATFYGREYELRHWRTTSPSGETIDFYSWSDTIR